MWASQPFLYAVAQFRTIQQEKDDFPIAFCPHKLGCWAESIVYQVEWFHPHLSQLLFPVLAKEGDVIILNPTYDILICWCFFLTRKGACHHTFLLCWANQRCGTHVRRTRLVSRTTICKCIDMYTQLPVYWVHIAKTNAATYTNPAINPTFMKVLTFRFCWNCLRKVLLHVLL